MRLDRTAVIGAALLALMACQPLAPPATEETSGPDAAVEAAQPPATPAGPPVTVAAEPGENREASVTEVVHLEGDSDAKLYSTAAGDPAINGLYTYIAVFGETPEYGWRVFRIGDFNTWRLEEVRADSVVLGVSRSWIGDDGAVQTAAERLIVSIPEPTAETITVTPAQ